MKKLLTRMMMIFSLCTIFSLGFFAQEAKAAGNDLSASVSKVAYFDADAKKLVLLATPFSDAGYTCKVTQADNESKSITMSVPAGTRDIRVDISDIYTANKVYNLKLTAKDSKDYFGVSYYTGAKLTGTKFDGNGGSIAASCKSVSGYDGYGFSVTNMSGTIKIYTQTYAKTAKATLTCPEYAIQEYRGFAVAKKGNSYGAGQNVAFTTIPKVRNAKATPGFGTAKVSWDRMPGAVKYRVAYKKSGAKKWTSVYTTDTEYTLKKLTAKKKYAFRVFAYTSSASSKAYDTVSCVIGKDPGAVKKAFFTVDNHGAFAVEWTALKGATGYAVYAKESGENSYKCLGETVGTRFTLEGFVDTNKSVSVYITAMVGESKSSKHSKAITDKGATFVKKNKLRILAKRVKTVSYKKGKVIYDAKQSYTDEIILAYCNYFHHKSKTKWLCWVSLYTQQAAILTGSEGHWTIHHRFDCAGGSYENRTPRGKHEIYKKEEKWPHPKTTTWWVSRFYKKASFHSRPHWNNGKIQDARMRKPVSNACVRCYDEEAIWIYKNIPIGTLVRVK